MSAVVTLRDAVDVAAPAPVVYRLVTDVTRMGEWSPECYRCEWLCGAGPAPRPGDRFRGWNRKNQLNWKTECEIEMADGEEFRFLVVKGAAGRRTRWSYRVEPTEHGCRVHEACEPLPMRLTVPRKLVRKLIVEPRRGRRDRTDELTEDIHATLVGLRREAERVSATA